MGTKNNPGTFDCVARAEPDEQMFTLLGRDPIGGSLVRLWAEAREQLATDPAKINEANDCAALMDAWCRSVGREPAEVLDLIPFPLLAAAIQRRKGVVMLEVRDDMPGDQFTITRAPLSPTLVLTGKQLRIAEMLAEDDETEVCVGFGSPEAKAGPGIYAWVQGYPDEGAVPLFDESVPLNEDRVSYADVIGGAPIAVTTESPPCAGYTAHVSAELWAVHVTGPDDIWPAPNKTAAEAASIRFNEWYGNRKDPSPMDPQMSATVIPWDGTFEQHAALLKNWHEFDARATRAEAGPAATA